jgi:hypothetical protein
VCVCSLSKPEEIPTSELVVSTAPVDSFVGGKAAPYLQTAPNKALQAMRYRARLSFCVRRLSQSITMYREISAEASV